MIRCSRTTIFLHGCTNRFRVSQLAALAREQVHTLGNAVRPHVAPNGLTVVDLRSERGIERSRERDKLARHHADVSVLFELAQAQHVPAFAHDIGLTVMERRARVAVMHRGRREVVGNVHLVHGTFLGPTRWTFAKGGQFVGGVNSDNVCLVRFNGDVRSHTLIVELSYLLAYSPSSDKSDVATRGSGAAQGSPEETPSVVTFELSCGWTGIDLSDVRTLFIVLTVLFHFLCDNFYDSIYFVS